MGFATTAPGRSADHIVEQMCEHICEPIQSTGRILPGEPGITMCAGNTAYALALTRVIEPTGGLNRRLHISKIRYLNAQKLFYCLSRGKRYCERSRRSTRCYSTQKCNSFGSLLADRPWHLPMRLCPRIRHLNNRPSVRIRMPGMKRKATSTAFAIFKSVVTVNVSPP
jgi:hypothetical protein